MLQFLVDVVTTPREIPWKVLKTERETFFSLELKQNDHKGKEKK